MKLGSSRGMDTNRPRGSESSKPCHESQLTRRSQPSYPWPPEQAQSGVSKPYRTTEPVALIGLLDQYFSAFDEIVVRHGLEKLKTIGDAYMAVAGVPTANRRHAVDTCLASLEIQAVMARMKAQREKMRLPALELRIGVHTGPVMSGVVGRRKFTFDIWGDAVNTAALMEANGAPGRINISETVAGKVKTLFELEPRGPVETKHNRKPEMFFLDRLKREYSRDADGRMPNEKFVAECDRLLGGGAAGVACYRPPDTVSTAPETNLAAGEMSQATASAISSGAPMRRNGVMASIRSRAA